MRSTILVSTAALLAGIGLASAQGMQGGGQSGGAPSTQSQGAPSGGAAAQERQSPQSSPSQRGGQAQQGEKEPMSEGPHRPRAATRSGRRGQSRAGRQGTAPSSGQGQRDQPSPSQAQSPQRQDNQQGGQASQGQAQGAQGSKTLTTEQRTTIRNTVVSKGPRASNVNFNISVGTAVPTSVRVVAVPSTLIKIYPEWRGHMYFVVNDEMVTSIAVTELSRCFRFKAARPRGAVFVAAPFSFSVL